MGQPTDNAGILYCPACAEPLGGFHRLREERDAAVCEKQMAIDHCERLTESCQKKDDVIAWLEDEVRQYRAAAKAK